MIIYNAWKNAFLTQRKVRRYVRFILYLVSPVLLFAPITAMVEYFYL
jgi:hypothetical protein